MAGAGVGWTIRAIVQDIHRDKSFLIDRKKGGFSAAESAEKLLGYSYAACMLVVAIWSLPRMGAVGLLMPVLPTALSLALLKLWDRLRHRAAVRAMSAAASRGPAGGEAEGSVRTEGASG